MANPRICSIPDCGKPLFQREWCSAHYSRWHRHGDPLGGSYMRDGQPLRYYHEVVLTYEGDECLIWPFGRTSNGYATLWVDGRKHIVSRLLCKEANSEPPTPKHDAAHSCGSGRTGCVTKRHLVWKTRLDNNADKLVHGTQRRGERCHLSKLTEADILEIRRLSKDLRHRAIAERYGISSQYVGTIANRKCWTWLP